MLTQGNKDHLNDLIRDQAGWIKWMQENQEKLEKYRDGKLPFDEQQIAQIANAQAQLAQATKNIAQAIGNVTGLHKELMVRLARLHSSLENQGNKGPDWTLARALEDRIGSSTPLSGDVDRAKQLLAKHGF